MIYRSRLNQLAALALMALLTSGGCIWGSVKYDRTLTKELIQKIESGKTSRKNILEWFGPPGILAEKDSVVSLPSTGTDQTEMRTVKANVFFKYFLWKHSITEHHAVYYYFNEREKINGISIPIPAGGLPLSLPTTVGDLRLSELWVLVNRSTGLVEDYVFLEWEED